MALYLVQHGKSLPKESDPEQGLSEEGTLEVQRMAALARDHGIRVMCIAHSGKKRARQTAEIFAAKLEPKSGLEERAGLNPLDDVTAVAHALQPDAGVMLVGHLPFMERLASYLTTGAPEKRILKFQNGGIVCLDRDPDSPSWFIRWTLMPQLI